MHGGRRIDVAGWVLPLAVVVPMLALASLLGTREIIFPEGAALVMGIWSLGLPGWSASRWRVAVLPPVFAAAGVLLLRANLSSTVTLLIAVTVALIALQLLDTRLAPSMSAAVLPIVFDVRDYSYPLAVLVISLVVAAGMSVFPRERQRGRGRRPRRRAAARGTVVSRGPTSSPSMPEPHRAAGSGRYATGAVAGAWLVIVTWILVGGELLALSAAAIAPPLFVSCLEWLGRGPLEAQVGLRRWALLVGAALCGSVATALVPVAWIAGALAIVATLVVMRLLAAPHPPALAIALIPQILGSTSTLAQPLSYTLAIAAGGGALYLGVYGVGVAARQPWRSRAPSPERA